MRTTWSRWRGMLALALAVSAVSAFPEADAAERHLTLDETIALALRHNDDIVVQREAIFAAQAAVTGARGAYDPLLQVSGGWRRASPPVNSAFSGAPGNALSPTIESLEVGAFVQQLLPWGGDVEAHSLTSRDKTDGAFTLLSPAYGTSVGLTLRQPLLRNRSIDAARLRNKVAAADSRLAGASLRTVIDEILTRTETAYWTLAATRRAVTVQEESVRLAEEQMQETRTRIEMGVAPDTEIAQPQAEIERRRGDLLATREAASRAQNALKLLVLGDSDDALWSDEIVVAAQPDVIAQPVDLAFSLQQALAARPELAAARAALERRQAETGYAQDSVKPALDALISYDRLGLAGEINPDGATLPGVTSTISDDLEGGLGRSYRSLGDGEFDDARATLVFSIPIGNRAARASATAARSAERQAEAELARARKIVRADVLDAAAALDTAGGRIEAARAARAAADVQLSAERDRYGAGLSTNFLVLTRQNDLSGARLDEISALTDYLTARAAMARATGSLLDERGITVEE